MAVAAKWIIGAVAVIVALATIWYFIQHPLTSNPAANSVASQTQPLGNAFQVSQAVESAVDPNAFRQVQTNPFETSGGG